MQPVKTPIDQGMIARAVNGIRSSVGGVMDAWFGPLKPLPPFAPPEQRPSVEGRQFDYPVGYNLTSTKPRQAEPVSFDQMRSLADGYDLMRLVIETRKDQLAKLKWQIKPKDDKKEPDAACKEIADFYAMPDKEHCWDDWLRMLIEDMLVIDAATLYPRMTRGGQLYALEPVDGATIKRVIDEHGRTPLPPMPAYQQILKGVPAIDYTRDELVYRPRNLRTHKIYGFSPVEQVIMTVNIAIRRQLNQLSYYTEGNVPNTIFRVPKEWNPDQISKFQRWWDELTAGESKHKGMFIPEGPDPIDTKAAALKDEYDEWLARIVCFAFSINPTPFIKQQNRATSENAHQQALEEGLAPIQQWIKNGRDYEIAKYFGRSDLEFAWAEEEAQDPLVQAQVAQIYVGAKVLHPDEVRADLGLPPLTPEQKEELNPPPPVPLGGDPNDAGDKPEGEDDPNKPAPDDASAKEALAKAGKALRPVDQDRPAVNAVRTTLKASTEAFFAAQAKKIAQQITDLAGTQKADGPMRLDRTRAKEILALLDFQDWIDDIPDMYAEALAGVAVDGGGEAVDQLGVTLADEAEKEIGAKATEWADDRAAEMVGKKWIGGELVDNPDAKWVITDSTREMIQDVTAQALEEGWSNDELADALQGNYAFSDVRAEMIARTETARADTQGQVIGWKAAGIKTKEWAAAPDCCDECQELDGETAPIDGTFAGGADVPLHPQCRCTCLPVVDEADDEGDQE